MPRFSLLPRHIEERLQGIEPTQDEACVTGNGVDFIQYPPGKGSRDVTAVIPHEGKRDESLVKAPSS